MNEIEKAYSSYKVNSTPSKLNFFKHTGPLTITDDERNEILIGVASWGYECGSADAPGVYAKVTSVLTWIDDIVFKDNQGKRCVHIVHTHEY